MVGVARAAPGQELEMNHEEADVDGEREENQKDSSDQEMFEEGCDGRLHVTKDDPELLDSEQPDVADNE